MATNEIKLKILVDNKEAVASLQLTDDNIKELYKSFKYGQAEVNGFATTLSRGLNNAREMIQGLGEVYNILKGITGSQTNAYQEQERAMAQLAQAMRSAGIYTDSAFQSLIAYSGQLQQTTIYGDELTIQTMAQLTAMGLTASQLQAATMQAANLASIMGTDLSAAVRVMGDLFNGEATMIKRYIKGLDDAVLKSGDLDAILQMLNERIGGQAVAMGETAYGATVKFTNAIGDLEENAGEMISSVLTPFATNLSSVIGKLNEFSPILSGLIGVASSLGVGFLTLNLTGMLPLIFNTANFRAQLDLMNVRLFLGGTAVSTFGRSIEIAKTSVRGFFASLGPLGWLSLALGAAATAMAVFGRSADAAEESVKSETQAIEKQRIEFNLLMNKLKDATAGKREKQHAIDELNKKYPEYLNKLNLETASLNDIAAAQANANREFERKIQLAVGEARTRSRIQDIAELQDKNQRLFKDIAGQQYRLLTDESGSEIGREYENMYAQIIYDQIADNKGKIEKINNEIQQMYNESAQLLSQATALPIRNKPGSDPKKEQSEIERLIAKRREELTLLELRNEKGKEDYRYQAAALAVYKEYSDLLISGKASTKEEIALRKEMFEIVERKSLAVSLDDIAKRINPAKEGFKSLADLLFMLQGLMQKLNEEENKSKILTKNEIITKEMVESLGQAFSAATGAMVRNGAAAVRVFRDAKSVLEIFINDLARAITEILAMKAAMSLLSFVFPGMGGGIFQTLFGGGGSEQSVPIPGGDSMFAAANGAIVTKPTLLMVGEGNEPEGVFPLSYLDRITRSGGSSSSISINLKLEPTEFRANGYDLRAVQNAIERKLRISR